MSDYHTQGSLVWVSDAEGWVKGTVQKVQGEKLLVQNEKGAVALYRAEDCPLQNPLARMGVEVSLRLHYQEFCFSWPSTSTMTVERGQSHGVAYGRFSSSLGCTCCSGDMGTCTCGSTLLARYVL